jgi:hypothetical protein
LFEGSGCQKKLSNSSQWRKVDAIPNDPENWNCFQSDYVNCDVPQEVYQFPPIHHSRKNEEKDESDEEASANERAPTEKVSAKEKNKFKGNKVKKTKGHTQKRKNAQVSQQVTHWQGEAFCELGNWRGFDWKTGDSEWKRKI